LSNQALTKVLKKQSANRRPMWFMRQAGRYLPEYRKVREKAGSFLDLCYNSELAAEVTLQPLQRYDLDAAIIFADILVVPHAMGNGLCFVEGEGPVLQTVRSAADVARLSSGVGSKQFSAVEESLSRVRRDLNSDIALIGFCGAPWTVASYMIEGRGSDRKFAIACATEGPPWFAELMNLLVDNSIAYLCMQVEAGADVLQIFDSWGGELANTLFEDFSIGPIKRIVTGVKAKHPDIPIIVFSKGAAHRHRAVYLDSKCDAVGIEAEYPMQSALQILPLDAVVQGNLDPELLLGPVEDMCRQVRNILAAVPRNRHIFNLGHGIKQQTSPDILNVVIRTVREFDNGMGHG
jgi:uroporphyrinogen decarboxylase